MKIIIISFVIILMSSFLQIANAKSIDASLELVKTKIGKGFSDYKIIRHTFKRSTPIEVILAHQLPDSPKSGTDFNAQLFLVELNKGKGVQIIANSKVAPEMEWEDSWIGYRDCEFSIHPKEFELDTNQFAIGIKFKSSLEFAAGEHHTEVLSLYMPIENKIIKIADINLSISDHQRGPGDDSGLRATVAVDNTSKNKMKDIIVSEKWVKTSLIYEGDSDEPATKKSSCEGKLIYQWIKDKYETKDKSCTELPNYAEKIEKQVEIEKSKLKAKDEK